MSLSTHILDTSRGRPAADVPVRLEAWRTGGWQVEDEGRTNSDGRLSGWHASTTGVYRLVFGVGEYLGPNAFYPEVTVTFRVADVDEYYHVPLLISPFGYSTYRGS